MKRKHIILASLAAAFVLVSAVGASAFVTHSLMKEEKPTTQAARSSTKETIAWNDRRATAPQPAQPARNCEDGNIVGKIAGGVAGGIAGNQIGSGNGQTAATIGGTLGGAYLGGEYIPTRNITCR